MIDFMICGLARSRTAWLAAFMHGDGVWCGHEVLAEKLPEQVPGLITGSCETTGFKVPMIANKLVVIHRDYREVENSVWFEFGVKVDAKEDSERLYALPGMHVEYQQLNDESMMRKVYDYCTGLPFPEAKYRLFKDLKITTLRFDLAYRR